MNYVLFTGFDIEIDEFDENFCRVLHPVFDVHLYSYEIYKDSQQLEHLLYHTALSSQAGLYRDRILDFVLLRKPGKMGVYYVKNYLNKK